MRPNSRRTAANGMNGFPGKRSVRGRRSGGFTLLELIAVIGIVALMATVVVGGFTGMAEAMARTAAWQSLQRAITLAREDATIDGNDTYLFAVDIDRFCLVRKAGVVTDLVEGEKPWGLNGSSKNCMWVVDEYADLADRWESFGVSFEKTDAGDLTEDAQKLSDIITEDWDGTLVFDITEGTYARITTPSHWESAIDAWVFGVERGASGFAVDNQYGWVTQPVYALPEGWVFEGTWKEDGTRDNAAIKAIKVHFEPGGKLEESVSIKIEKPASGQKMEISVTNTGVKPVKN